MTTTKELYLKNAETQVEDKTKYVDSVKHHRVQFWTITITKSISFLWLKTRRLMLRTYQVSTS